MDFENGVSIDFNALNNKQLRAAAAEILAVAEQRSMRLAQFSGLQLLAEEISTGSAEEVSLVDLSTDPRLDIGVEELLADIAPSPAIKNRLLGDGRMRTVRDILTFGQVGALDVRKIGAGSVETIKRALDSLNLPIEWKERPTAADVACLHADLTTVPATAVVNIDTYNSYFSASVQDLSEVPEDEAWRYTNGLFMEREDNFSRVRQFVDEFAAARSQIEAATTVN